MKLEVRTTAPTQPTQRTPVILVHGSYHAAWCWQHFAPRLTEQGYTCHAISLRGQGASDKGGLKARGMNMWPSVGISQVSAANPSQQHCTRVIIQVGGTLQSHAEDLDHYVRAVTEAAGPAVIVSHSLGGAVVQRLLADGDAAARLRGVVLMASMPPAGATSMVGRMLKATPLITAQVSWSFISRNFMTDVEAFRRYA